MCWSVGSELGVVINFVIRTRQSCHRVVIGLCRRRRRNRNGNAATTGAADCSSCGPSVCRVGLEIDKSARQDGTGRDGTGRFVNKARE